MGNTAIRVEGLGKQYRISGKQARYYTLRESIVTGITAPFRRAGQLLRGQAYGAANLDEEIWALRDVSFEVQHGEVVGIIGRNGAGKSTLLKVLSRITEPTTGEAWIRGRIGALLEVGTGFHPELTGRENIYLNGAILGMHRKEIDRKFDEIVDFSGVEKFIDTPVKHYSSGMGLRLGFAVAAHLEPDILVVDEVLAVGDAEFQRKCLGKLGDVASGGRTVLFVSHNMAAIQTLCPRGILLEAGQIEVDGTTQEAINHYLNQQRIDTTHYEALDQIERANKQHGQIVRLTRCSIGDMNGNFTTHFGFGEPFVITLECRAHREVTDVAFLVGINDLYRQRILTITSLEANAVFDAETGEVVSGKLVVENLLLKPGAYYLTLGLFSTNKSIDVIHEVIRLEISEAAKHYKHIKQITIGYLQIPNPNWSVQKLTPTD